MQLKDSLAFRLTGKLVVLAFFWATLPHPAFPESAQSHLEKGLEYYDNLYYEKAIPKLKEALRIGLTEKDDQIKAHKFLALAYIVEAQSEEAKIHFQQILRIDPKFRLDPNLSPKFLPIFDEVAKQMRPAEVKKKRKKTLWYLLGGAVLAGATTAIVVVTGGGEVPPAVSRIPDPPPPP